MGRVSMPQGKGSLMHNRREYEKYGRSVPENIDVSKTHENITFVDKDIRDAYQEIFGEALEKYNGKQKRADRRIESYYDHVQKSKNGEQLFYEDVLQWGSKDDFQDPQTRERAKEALVKYVETFEERNPNLKLIGAYIHMDEASPHLHFDYIPVAHGYSRGLEIRNSLDKAMKQMGFLPEKETRRNNATKLWKDRERATFREICCSLGLEVEAERPSTRKSLSVEEYKDARDAMLSDIELDVQSLTSKKTSLQGELEALEELRERRERELEALATENLRLEQERASLIEERDTVKTEVQEYAAYRTELAEIIPQLQEIAEQTEKSCEWALERFTNQLERFNPPVPQISKHELNQIRPEKGLMGMIKGISLQTIQNIVQSLRSMLSWADDVQQELKTAKQLLPKKESLRQRLDAANKSLLQRTPMEKSKQHDTKKRNTPSL